MSTNEWMNKENVAYIHTYMYVSATKKDTSKPFEKNGL